MKLVVHRMAGCLLCEKCEQLLSEWNIPFTSVYDKPKKDRPYPYITIELEYEEVMDWISREKLQ